MLLLMIPYFSSKVYTYLYEKNFFISFLGYRVFIFKNPPYRLPYGSQPLTSLATPNPIPQKGEDLLLGRFFVTAHPILDLGSIAFTKGGLRAIAT